MDVDAAGVTFEDVNTAIQVIASFLAPGVVNLTRYIVDIMQDGLAAMGNFRTLPVQVVPAMNQRKNDLCGPPTYVISGKRRF
jgi:hypothetical protein